MADAPGPSKRSGSPAAEPTPKRERAAVEVVDLTRSDDDDDDAPPPPPAAAPPPQQQQGAAAADLPAFLDAPFSLWRVRDGALPAWASDGFLGARVAEVVAAGCTWALVSNFMVDLPWLISAAPALAAPAAVLERLILCHGEKGAEARAGLAAAAAAAGLGGRFVAHTPPVPPYGTHHSKAFFLKYPAGLRVCVHTANAIYLDFNLKSQGAFTQDFPPKDAASPPSSPFEAELLQYLEALRLPPALAVQARARVAAHDFSAARGRLVASTPGDGGGAAHHGPALRAYGLNKLRAALEAEPGGFAPRFAGAPLLAQYSSVGSTNPAWLLGQFVAALSAGRAAGAGAPLGPPAAGAGGLALVWPAAEEVRDSIEGWFAGRSIPGPAANVSRAHLAPLYRRWGGAPAGRQRAMPHIKSYCRYDPASGDLAWFLLTSSNLSKAAWGEAQTSRIAAGRPQVRMLSFELGVLLSPALERAYRLSRWRGFCAAGPRAGTALGQTPGLAAGAEVRFVAWRRGEPQRAALEDGGAALRVPLPVPYELPPPPYAADERPWSVDTPFTGRDALNLPWPGAGRHYGLLEQDG
jgi:tyrosyl-DNA phosphodiesterase-1